MFSPRITSDGKPTQSDDKSKLMLTKKPQGIV